MKVDVRGGLPGVSPRSMSAALGLWEYGLPLYTASRSFSFTCITVSQFRHLTVTSSPFSFSGFTQCSVWSQGHRGCLV